MNNIERLFAPLIDQIVWSVCRGHGSFLTLQFGKAHLEVREPFTTKSDNHKGGENAMRRRIFIHGQWDLWVQAARWNISACGKTCRDDDEPSKVDDVLRFIDGQKLSRVSCAHDTLALNLEYDLGGIIRLNAPDKWTMDDLWSLTDANAGIMNIYHKDGTIRIHQTQPYPPGSIGISSASK